MSELWSAEVAAAVSQHMNDDHADDCLLIVRALTDRPDATSARMTGMDPDGLVFGVRTPEGEAEVVVPWPAQPLSRADVRVQVVALHQRAAAAAETTRAADPSTP